MKKIKTKVNKKYTGVNLILQEAFKRIFAMTTKRTFAEEVEFIAKEVDKYYKKKYILKARRK